VVGWRREAAAGKQKRRREQERSGYRDRSARTCEAGQYAPNGGQRRSCKIARDRPRGKSSGDSIWLDLLEAKGRRNGIESAAEQHQSELDWYDDYLAKGDADRSANTTLGNKKGGLANIVEKSLGSIVKSGSSAIVDMLSPGERVRKKGMTFAATLASDFICGALQFASGMTLQVFTTGRGTPYELAAAAAIEVSTRTELARRWKDLIDFDAGRIATGEATIEDTGWDLFRLILEVASGRTKVWSDRWGIHNDLTLCTPGSVT
jgi:galactarate dehydratase